MSPGDLVEAIREADARLDATLAAMTDAEALEPSLLDGWTRSMVATHIARNGDSNALMVDAHLRGETRAQYPGGDEQRAADIEAGRGRTAAELRADVREAAALWHEVFGRVTDFDAVVQAGIGPRPISQRVASRLLEVEVHHADLGLAYTWRDWPVGFAEDQVARRLRSVGEDGPGGDPRAVLAWLMGRESAEAVGLVLDDARVASLPERYPFG